METLLFDFEPFKKRGGHSGWKRLTGVTMTVYSNHVGLTKELLDLLGNPEYVTVGYIKNLNMIGIIADPDGMKVSTGRTRNQIGGKEIRECVKAHYPYDENKYFVRLTKGMKAGDYVIFSFDNVELVERHDRRNHDFR